MAVLLTTDQVEEWKAERDKLVKRIAYLDERIKAASFFMADDETESEPSGDDGHQSSPGPSLVDAIVDVLRRFGPEPMTNHAIRNRLTDVGFDISQMSQNYYYTATKRLSDKGTIVKHDDGTYSLPENAAPEESLYSDSSSGANIESRFSQPTEPPAQGREAGPGGET
ncbi:hypothetical protein OB2597_09799 [Pseudooceanicola batsensis HTCC2597]|uniref:Uncharacterized protein n=1 Tax=Pseudooceanicola batsensis (strain ATCC BAA-863 / DSM 15984 / KCTC 12145 / HTCC2597) TaxID=252305 RepID=A3TV82_PSEBH|nr:hypothetical protein [Pseudooceanicola batsensis]EAQ04428.1 hypothetical protein OB2597_09799 [Pseudooceanicola batsensis HTCC2597]